MLIVDDHPMWRDTLRKVLTHAGARVVGEATSGDDAVSLARRLSPDVIIMDVNLPGIDGIEATRRVLAQDPAAKVLALSSSDDPVHVIETVKAGAAGYLMKTATAAEVMDAVRRVFDGEAVLPATLSDLVLGEFRRLATGGPQTALADDAGSRAIGSSPVDRLTPRERDVLALMAEGRSNKAIAERLFLGSKSVEAHVRSIFTKFGLEPAPDDSRRVLAVLTYLRDHGR